MVDTRSYALGRCVATGLLGTLILSGCSGLRPYPNDLERNVVIRTVSDSGSVFSKVGVDVDIFSVEANCETEYLGTVDLSDPSVEIGIPPDRLSYMVFVFSNSSFLGSSRSTLSHEALVEARAGYHYDIRVSYVDDLYNVAISETDPRTTGERKIAVRDISACKSL
jgi:hypothetical protein